MDTTQTEVSATVETPLTDIRPELADPASILIRVKDVSALTGLAKATIYKYIQDEPGFPQPVPLSSSAARGAPVGFVLAEVQQWAASRIAARNARTAAQG